MFINQKEKIIMNEQEILKKVQDIVVDELDVDAADVTLEADIKDDLDADSLDVFEIMNELEDDLDIKLEASEDVKTIQDVVNYVKKEIDAKAE
ncbi:hypothetical protein FC65_GL001449 [Ligilactobacillus acidipiscis DSM 15836]|uniref:Acyl carrier protein n=3 Tax=Ligilactobacillus acidipiscis TaxID=89059 RepID=A0A0R2KBK4_9LACO|nr:hypothetical protein FC65_GL001449 [Ligilactobacillus acidipiscis DSM 15836]KRN86872.1 hypothetical protein IV43_GL000301 [Ligilactobacillus acidipiscis]